MPRPRLLSLVLSVPLWLALSVGAWAQGNPTTGKTIYDNICAGCHGANPAGNKDRILNGKTSSGIIFAFQAYPKDMPYSPGPNSPLSFTDIDDIAAYIATKAPTGSAQFSASPTTQNFGSVAVGSQGTGVTFTLTNIGSVSGTITAVNNTNAAEFPVTGGTCTATPKSVANGATCTIVVAFKPSATGARSGSVTVTNSGVVSPLSLTFSGTGGAGATPGQLSMPGTHVFGTQPLNAQSAAWSATISNVGGSPVTISGVTNSNSGEFPVTVNTCSGSLGAGASCAVSIAFKPVAAGARGATFTVNSTGLGSPQTFSVSGTGQAAATPGQLSVPGAVAFGAQGIGTPAGQPVTITNVGGSAVTFGSVSSNNAEFALSGNTCVGSLPAGNSCGFTVTFTPAAAGARGATITVNSTGLSSPQSINASGTGTTVPPPTGQKVAVIEYYHASFNHYFVTAIPDEITKLDNGTFVGWARTGRQFNVYSAATGSTSPVCRFFSTNFAPKSSHFYTPSVSECNGLKTNPDWAFEAEVFHMITSPLGTCPAGTVPVYRLYNNGEGGAPNHRYSTEQATKMQMMGMGWLPEGNGNDAVFMCSPL